MFNTHYIHGVILIALTAFAPGCSDDNSAAPITAPESDVVNEGNPAPLGINQLFLNVATASPDFGGAYVDNNGRVHVLTTTPETAQRAISALDRVFEGSRSTLQRQLHSKGPLVERAQHGFRDLLKWHDLILISLPASYGVTMIDIDEVANKVVVGIADLGRRDELAGALHSAGIPRDALEIVRSLPISATTDSIPLYMNPLPLRGGVLFENDYPSAGCTLGFIAHNWEFRYFWETTKYVFVNTHCTRRIANADNNPNTLLLSANTAIGSERFDPLPFNPSGCPSAWHCRLADAALFAVDEQFADELGYIARPTALGSLMYNVSDRFHIIGEGSAAVIGDPVERVGKSSGWSHGVVDATCRTYLAEYGIYQVCQDRATASVQRGDSGSPVFRITSGYDVYLYGIAWGSDNGSTVYSPMSNIHAEFGGFVVN